VPGWMVRASLRKSIETDSVERARCRRFARCKYGRHAVPTGTRHSRTDGPSAATSTRVHECAVLGSGRLPFVAFRALMISPDFTRFRTVSQGPTKFAVVQCRSITTHGSTRFGKVSLRSASADSVGQGSARHQSDGVRHRRAFADHRDQRSAANRTRLARAGFGPDTETGPEAACTAF
jgi:hypothetical protein